MLEKILSILLNETLVEKIFLIAGILGPVVGLCLGAITGKIRNNLKIDSLKGLFFGFLGTLNYFIYQLYLKLVGYNPETETVGLHQIKILLLNAIIFIVLGVCLGLLYRLFFKKYEK